MRSLSEWSVADDGRSDADILANGNRLLIGNGYLGYRGTVEEADASHLPACCLSGVYDRVGELWREPVNAPNGLSVRLGPQVGGAGDSGAFLSIKDETLVSHTQSLDFRYGIHSRVSSWKAGGATVTVRAERFASMDEVHLLCLRYLVSADADLGLEIRQGIDCELWDINGPHLEGHAFHKEGRVLAVGCRTRELGLSLAVAAASSFPAAVEGSEVEGQGSCRSFSLQAKRGVEYELLVYCSVYTDLDGRGQALASAMGTAAKAAEAGYGALLGAHKNKWDSIWAMGDVVIEGDDYARRTLRYSLYHLQIIAPRHSRSLSIPARGLSGQTYKGAIFWDTEMFIAPYFLFTDPEVARSFIRYRIETLDGARRKAAEYGYRGAFYAWESQETGDDACSHFNVVDVFTGRPMRTYFRDKQIHISADIVHSIRRYVEATGDASILEEGGLEVILECARFFLSYAYYSPERRRYEILDVTGPDEYHERVNNDAFTNRMVKRCLDTAWEYLGLFRGTAPESLAALLGKLGFESDLKRLEEMREKLYLPSPGEDGIIEQFDGYYELEDCRPADLKARLLDPKEYWGGANGVASGTRVIKQADVVLMLQLFAADYPREILKANLDFYEPRTEHGSSLSSCVYSLLACETGDSLWAYPFFGKTAEIDLTGDSKQYAGLIYIGGTHPAASGGAWMAAVLGFCGFSAEGGTISLKPRLPAAWTKLSFSIALRGRRYFVEATKEGFSVREK
jgi:nigerose phosphorylase